MPSIWISSGDAEVDIVVLHDLEEVWIGHDLELSNASTYGFEGCLTTVVGNVYSYDLVVLDSIDERRITNISPKNILLRISHGNRLLSLCDSNISHGWSRVLEKGEGKSKGGERILHWLEIWVAHDLGKSSMNIFHDLFWLILNRNVHEILECLI